jgi:hypothetical protein
MLDLKSTFSRHQYFLTSSIPKNRVPCVEADAIATMGIEIAFEMGRLSPDRIVPVIGR